MIWGVDLARGPCCSCVSVLVSTEVEEVPEGVVMVSVHSHLTVRPNDCHPWTLFLLVRSPLLTICQGNLLGLFCYWVCLDAWYLVALADGVLLQILSLSLFLYSDNFVLNSSFSLSYGNEAGNERN